MTSRQRIQLLIGTATVLSAVGLAEQATTPASPQAPQAQSSPAQSPQSSIDTATVGCDTGTAEPRVTIAKVKEMVAAKVPPAVVISLIQESSGDLMPSPDVVIELAKAGASEEVLAAILDGPEVYIGWSVMPSKIVRDNYGQYVTNKYFGIEVAIANRTQKSIIVTALEFCHDGLRDVSEDPPMVRGSLQKGEIAGHRNRISSTIQAIGGLASPSAAFFKNQIHRGTFSAGAALFTPLKSAWDLIAPNTLLTYLDNWDKDEVFKKGFIVPAGGERRGRVFLPIEQIYPRQLQGAKTNPEAHEKWRQATKGNYDPSEIKRRIGALVVLGQQIKLEQQRRYIKAE